MWRTFEKAALSDFGRPNHAATIQGMNMLTFTILLMAGNCNLSNNLNKFETILKTLLIHCGENCTKHTLITNNTKWLQQQDCNRMVKKYVKNVDAV